MIGRYEFDPPNTKAIENAEYLVSELAKRDFIPERIIASADGGVDILFFIENGYVSLECFNEDEIVGGIQLKGKEPEVWDITLTEQDINDLLVRLGELRANSWDSNS